MCSLLHASLKDYPKGRLMLEHSREKTKAIQVIGKMTKFALQQ